MSQNHQIPKYWQKINHRNYFGKTNIANKDLGPLAWLEELIPAR